MDRRRTVALIISVVLCLALLGSWFARFDKEDAPSTSEPVTVDSRASGGLVGELVQIPRKDSKDGGAVPYPAPIGPGMFRGRVVDAVSREPVREFTIELVPPVQRPSSQIRQSFRTKDGRFMYRGLPTGIWTVFATAAGYQRFDIADVRISEAEPPEVLIPMRAGFSVRGRVVDEITSEGIGSATISFREASTGRYEGNNHHRPSVRSRKDGSFTLDGVPPGAVRLAASAGGYVGTELEAFVDGKTSPVEFALSKGASVSGYLAGADGLTPVAGEATLVNLDANTATQISTGSAGEFTFARLSAGRHRLIGRGGGLNGQREIDLAHNEQLEGLVLPMTAGHTVRGLVSGLRAEERAEAVVAVSAVNSRTGMTDQADVDERGAYEIQGVAPGRIFVEAISNRRGRVSQTATMPADGDLTVNLEFQGGARLTGRITRDGKPAARAVLSVVTSAADDELYSHSVVASNTGDYAVTDVPDGEYMLTVDGYSAENVRVSGDTVFDLDVPEAQLSGRVLEEGGTAPLVGALVDVRPVPLGTHTNRLIDRTDHFGQFALRGLQPGDFLLTAYKPGYELYRAPLSYGSPIRQMTIPMRPARGVEIRVRDAETNKPIASFVVAETGYGSSGLVVQLQADQNGVSYLPSGLGGSSLRIAAADYAPMQITSWNGQQLDLSLQRLPSR